MEVKCDEKEFVFFACMLLVMQSFVIVTNASEIGTYENCELEARYEYIEKCRVELNYSSNVAMCRVEILGPEKPNRISGTITLYDETSDYIMGSWDFNQLGNSYNFAQNVSVQSGHEYTLFLDGTLYTSDGNEESFQKSTTRRN